MPRTDSVPSLLQQVREKSAWVMAQAKHVRIHHDKIENYARWLIDNCPLVTELDGVNHFVSEASPLQTAAYVMALDAINFGSGYFDIARDKGISFSYETVAAGLKKEFLTDRMNTPQKWRRARARNCHDIFNLPAGTDPALDELMSLFAIHLNALGKEIETGFGDIDGFLSDAGRSAVRMVEILASWREFADFQTYRGEKIPVLKRAQILVADLHLAFGNNYFSDIGQLTCFADNMVPHILRCDGMLEYTADLTARIDRGALIAQRSEEETELRCASIYAVELIKSHLPGMTSMNIDHILWNRGNSLNTAHKLHRTLTTFY